MKDAEIANHGGSIIFKQNQELNGFAKETLATLDGNEKNCIIEKQKLELEKSKAILNFGNPGRDIKIAELDDRISKIRIEKQKIESEVRSRSTYMEVGQILKDLNIDTGEIMTGVRTAGELMKKLQDKVLEDQKIPFEQDKKEYIGKLRNAKDLVDQKKRVFVDMNSK